MMYITSDQVHASSYDRDLLISRCPRCGKTIQIDMDEINYCDNCWADIEVKMVPPQKPTERIAHGC